MVDLQARAARIFASLTLRLVLLGIIALLVFNTYADFAIKGPLGIGFHYEGWKPSAERLQHDLDNVKAAQEVALERALEAKHRAETKYMTLANRIDLDAQNARTGAMADAERFIVANRVRCQAVGGSGSGTVAASGDRDPSVPESLPAGPFVAVSEADVRACTGAASYAVSAHNWAAGLEAASGD
jgi:hypothetical protein